MAITVDPNDFKVPYAIGADGNLYQIGNGRPVCPDIFCPICRSAVAFVRESDARAAHFRHNDRQGCDAHAAFHRQTLHDAVRDATALLLNSGVTAWRICEGGSGTLPTGRVAVEEAQSTGDRAHRPDITVHPREGERAPILELEVVYSHRPEPERIQRAARDGRLIAVLNIAPIERDYYKKLWAGEQWDIPEACRTFVLDRRFDILDNADVRRIIRGVLDRIYLPARIRSEHADTPRASMPAPTPHRKGRPGLPVKPNTCFACGASDWRVSLTLADGRTAHVGCLPEFREAVDEISRQTSTFAPVTDGISRVDR